MDAFCHTKNATVCLVNSLLSHVSLCGELNFSFIPKLHFQIASIPGTLGRLVCHLLFACLEFLEQDGHYLHL